MRKLILMFTLLFISHFAFADRVCPGESQIHVTKGDDILHFTVDAEGWNYNAMPFYSLETNGDEFEIVFIEAGLLSYDDGDGVHCRYYVEEEMDEYYSIIHGILTLNTKKLIPDTNLSSLWEIDNYFGLICSSTLQECSW